MCWWLSSGIFLGMQVTDWNEARNTRQAANEALELLARETAGNLEAARKEADSVEMHSAAFKGMYDILRSCSSDPADLEYVNERLIFTDNSVSLRLNTDAIESLLADTRLLAEVDRSLVNRIKAHRLVLKDNLEAIRNLTGAQDETSILTLPAVQHVNDRETFDLGGGLAFSVPIEQACKDQELVKRLFIKTLLWKPAKGLVADIEKSLVAMLEALEAYQIESAPQPDEATP